MAHQSVPLTPATWLCPIKSLHSSKTKNNKKTSEWRRKRSWADLSQLNCDDDGGRDDEARALIKEKKGPQALSDVEKKGSSLWCIFLRTARSVSRWLPLTLPRGLREIGSLSRIFFFTHDSIWYGVGYMLPNMPVQMFFSIRCLISGECTSIRWSLLTA